MHSIFARINNTSALLSSCLMALLAAIAVSTFVFTAQPSGNVNIASVQVQSGQTRRYATKRQDLAYVDFNITADFTPLFNWNTKQVFLYLQAEFDDRKGVKNEVVVWDRIVRSKDQAKISVIGKNKYNLRELSASFKNISPASYSLKYNIMPYVGVLTYGEAARTTEDVPFPPRKTRV
ncbi:signal peptidase 22 kDa subunit [Coprinopsis marcescibilis]|uniref:Signal peptidase subunit 3 n=1 Tax=Coprinopsis marcescibilis TaxID=230819 RepID=A0A5C3L2E7_COPMA|nr:signal peptidase 22 kDa subunit [Coprinopsis marcescibilis]